jgi:hypothetical protein
MKTSLTNPKQFTYWLIAPSNYRGTNSAKTTFNNFRSDKRTSSTNNWMQR